MARAEMLGGALALAATLSGAAVWASGATPAQNAGATEAPVPALDFAAAPSPGTTGTVPVPPLPAEPVDAAPAAATARPFVLAGSALDQSRAIECLATAIYYEAASESDDGQRAVAQVVLNRVRHPAFPASVCGVVYQGSERSTGCQFSFTCDGALARRPSAAGWARARRIALAALTGEVFAPAGLATHYHTYAVRPRWNRGLVMTTAIGAHFFHRWKGYWGTAPGFTQTYAGREAMPVRAATAPIASPAAFAGLQTAPAIGPLPAGTAVAHQPAPQVHDKYRDSGQWIGPASGDAL